MEMGEELDNPHLAYDSNEHETCGDEEQGGGEEGKSWLRKRMAAL